MEKRLPEGLLYQPELITAGEEQGLLGEIQALEFHEVRMHGVAARRRVLHYGMLYQFD